MNEAGSIYSIYYHKDERIAYWFAYHRSLVCISLNTLSTRLLTEYQHSIEEEHYVECPKGFLGWVRSKTFKWVVVVSCLTFDMNG